ncbi:GL20144 [Drosophila persimilis]|uniref:Probable RNA-binding protein 18 n=1 Tax=Drosophila persimilis TaxID=7234 RepID=B4GY54_DROPE|nr:GL20144 [Drosophila persimilis]
MHLQACTSGGGGSAGAGEGATAAAAGAGEEQRRIWVGNLDSRITEFQLLKLMQKCGPIEKFDMLFHKGGPMVGQSRGYAFVTFAEVATNALLKLDGTSVGSRSIAVRLAKNIKYDDLQKPKPRIEIPALGTGKREEKISKSEAIRAIEAKLETSGTPHRRQSSSSTPGRGLTRTFPSSSATSSTRIATILSAMENPRPPTIDNSVRSDVELGPPGGKHSGHQILVLRALPQQQTA